MNRRFLNWTFVGAMIAILSGAGPGTANAQDAQSAPQQGGAMRTACGKDMQSLCPGLAGKDAAKCLIKEHRAQLSAECSAFFKEAKERRSATQSGAPAPSPPGGAETAGTQGGQSPPRQGGAMRTACSKDMQSLCPGLVGKDAAKCLMKEHRAQLSTECLTFFKEARARRNATQSGAAQPGGASNSPAPGTSEGGAEH